MTGHNHGCRRGRSHSDAAQRISDTYNLHRLADPYGSIGKWFAAALEDGRSDNVLYDDKYSAVIHQKHNEKYYTFLKIGPPSATPCDMEIMLETARRLYANGLRMSDPDHKHGGPDLIRRLTNEDQLNFLKGAVTNLVMPWDKEGK